MVFLNTEFKVLDGFKKIFQLCNAEGSLFEDFISKTIPFYIEPILTIILFYYILEIKTIDSFKVHLLS